ncbi:MAG: alpha/beta hydrolase [Blastocatellia bacterium]
MYFAKYGTGESVIVGLHGWSGDRRTFDPLMTHLPPGISFYSFDVPGSGNSPPPAKWQMNSIVSQIGEILMTVAPCCITLIGSCSGGLLCLFLAKHLAHTATVTKINRIVLLDPYAYLPWYFQAFVAPQMGKIGWYAYYTTFANPVGRWLTNLSLHKRRTKNAHLTNSFAAVNHQAVYQQLKLLSESGAAEQFRGLTLPIDILYGEHTFAAVKDSVKRWKEIFPQANCYALKNAGHLPLEEATEQVATILFQQNVENCYES